MTDRELLELAAKAAGIDYKKDDRDWGHEDHCAFWSYDDLCTCGARWNPLLDDGDALRLAVKLGDTFLVKVSICRQIDKASCYSDSVGARENLGTDPLAATRRAIVRAAAEIGRSMT